MNLIQRLSNIWRLGEVEIKDGKLLPPPIKFEEKPIKMAEIIKLKSNEQVITELLEDK